MTNNALINAGAAALYIAGGVLAGFYVAPHLGSLENTPAAPMLMISLLVFSVATMGYLFFYQPTVLLIAGKQQQALRLFLSTLAYFAVFISGTLFLFLMLSAGNTQ